MVSAGEFSASPDCRPDVELPSGSEFDQPCKIGFGSVGIANLAVRKMLEVDEAAEHGRFRAEAVERFVPQLMRDACVGGEPV